MGQKTAWDAAALTEADINLYLMGEGGAWTSWTPTVTQSGSVPVTNTRSRFARYGRTIHFNANLSVTGTGTASNEIVISLPVAAAAVMVAGTGWIYDSSASTAFVGPLQTSAGSSMVVLAGGASSGGAYGLVVMTAALASGDLIRVSGTYEAAS